MKKLVIVGDGKIADVAFQCFTKDEDWDVVGFAVEKKFRKKSQYRGLPVSELENLSRDYDSQNISLFVAVGYHECNLVRQRIFQHLAKEGYDFASYVSSFASVPRDFSPPRNVLVQEFVSIQAGASLEENVFLFSGCTVGHHAFLGAHSWVASGVSIGGASKIGELGFLGLNATIGHEVTIGHRSFIGASSLVLKDLPDGSVVIERESEKMRLDVDHFLRFTQMK